MSKEVKIALIGAAATILAAIISGIFLLRSISLNQSNSSPASNPPPITSNAVNTPVSNPVTSSTTITVTSSTPQQTLTLFCDALKSRDYATQYNLFSSSVQSRASEAQYAAQVEQSDSQAGGVTSCIVSNVNQSGSSATGTLSLTFGNGVTGDEFYTLILENGVWKINSIQS